MLPLIYSPNSTDHGEREHHTSRPHLRDCRYLNDLHSSPWLVHASHLTTPPDVNSQMESVRQWRAPSSLITETDKIWSRSSDTANNQELSVCYVILLYLLFILLHWWYNELCMHTQAHTFIRTYIPPYICASTPYVHTYGHTYVCTYIRTCYIRTCMHANTHTRVYAYTYVHMYILIYVHTCIHAYVHTHIHTCLHAYIVHTYTHTRQHT